MEGKPGAVVEGSQYGQPEGAEGAGRAYLDRLQRRQRAEAEVDRRAEFLQARVARAVRGIVRDQARSPRSGVANSLILSHLVARGDVARYRVAVHTIASREPRLRLLLSGPWAPYSFARIADG